MTGLVHTELATVNRIAEAVHAPVSSSLGSPHTIDLSFAAYAEADREKLKSNALLLIKIDRLHKGSASEAEIEK